MAKAAGNSYSLDLKTPRPPPTLPYRLNVSRRPEDFDDAMNIGNGAGAPAGELAPRRRSTWRCYCRSVSSVEKYDGNVSHGFGRLSLVR